VTAPLFDSFRRGEVADEVKMLAAQGHVAPRGAEQLAILVLLAGDADPKIRETTETTLARIPSSVLSRFIARHDVPEGVREFFVNRGIPVADTPAADAEAPLVDEDQTDYGREPETEEERDSLVRKLATMSVPEKVKAAMKGTREMRAILVRDPNKMVSLAVLSSPKLSETEIESIVRMGSVGEDVLRNIAKSRQWIKNYGVVLGLVKNPKTPLAISLNLLNRLVEKDLKGISISRNVPEPLRVAARKKVVMG
jgi:hypothetical protein